MRDIRKQRLFHVLVFLLVAALGNAICGPAVRAASHREAPLIAQDPTADNTDVYAFVSYDEVNLARPAADRRVTFVMNVIPGEDPTDGPNYFDFDDTVLYDINIDNDRDGKAEDIVYEFRFQTENRPVPGLTAGAVSRQSAYSCGGRAAGDYRPGRSRVEGLTRRQTYTVTEVRNGTRHELFSGRALVAVPSNVGPATMPNYPALAAQGIYTDASTGIRVFAGQRAETFYIDLGAVFDTLNLRRYLPLLTGPREDTDTAQPLRGESLQWLQRQHHRHRGADQGDHQRRQAGRHGEASGHRDVCQRRTATDEGARQRR